MSVSTTRTTTTSVTTSDSTTVSRSPSSTFTPTKAAVAGQSGVTGASGTTGTSGTAGSHGGTTPGSHTGSATGSHGGTTPGSHSGSATGSHGGTTPGSHGGSATGSHSGSKSGSGGSSHGSGSDSSSSSPGVSINGQCCVSGVLDADGQCCSGHIDCFGVCDGDESSGMQHVTTTVSCDWQQYDHTQLDDPTSPTRQQFDRDFSSYVCNTLNRPPSTVTVTGCAVTWPSGHRRLQTATAEVSFALLPYGGPNNLPLSSLQQLLVATGGVTSGSSTGSATSSVAFSIVSVDDASVATVCGNGVCETGEGLDPVTHTVACPSDCANSALNCPVVNGVVCNGAGVCTASLDGTGVCSCNVLQGYSGDDCSVCAVGFVALDGGVCVKLSLGDALLSNSTVVVAASPSAVVVPVSTSPLLPMSSSSSSQVCDELCVFIRGNVFVSAVTRSNSICASCSGCVVVVVMSLLAVTVVPLALGCAAVSDVLSGIGLCCSC